VYAVHPGTPVASSLMRDMPIVSTSLFGIKPLFFYVLARESIDGAQGILKAALQPDGTKNHGTYTEFVLFFINYNQLSNR
jgi:hypothetical protein